MTVSNLEADWLRKCMTQNCYYNTRGNRGTKLHVMRSAHLYSCVSCCDWPQVLRVTFVTMMRTHTPALFSIPILYYFLFPLAFQLHATKTWVFLAAKTTTNVKSHNHSSHSPFFFFFFNLPLLKSPFSRVTRKNS